MGGLCITTCMVNNIMYAEWCVATDAENNKEFFMLGTKGI